MRKHVHIYTICKYHLYGILGFDSSILQIPNKYGFYFPKRPAWHLAGWLTTWMSNRFGKGTPPLPAWWVR